MSFFKKICFVSLLAIAGNQALAFPITEVSDLSDRFNGLPFIKNAEIAVTNAPGFAAVQPTAHIDFSYSSCAAMNFVVEKEQGYRSQEKTTFVAVVIAPNSRDCRGPVVSRDYHVQISADTFEDGAYILANPTALKVKTNNPIVLPPLEPIDLPVPLPPVGACTAIAGVVYNPATDTCQGFSNGCHLDSLVRQGYEFPQNGQCSN